MEHPHLLDLNCFYNIHLEGIHCREINWIGLLQMDSVPEILMVDFDWRTRATAAAGVGSLTGECLADRGIFGTASWTPNCLQGIGKAPPIRLFLGVTGKIVVALIAEMSLSLSEMRLIGKLGAVRLIHWSLMVRIGM